MVVFVSVYQGIRTYLLENPSEEYLELSKKIRWVYLGLYGLSMELYGMGRTLQTFNTKKNSCAAI